MHTARRGRSLAAICFSFGCILRDLILPIFIPLVLIDILSGTQLLYSTGAQCLARNPSERSHNAHLRVDDPFERNDGDFDVTSLNSFDPTSTPQTVSERYERIQAHCRKTHLASREEQTRWLVFFVMLALTAPPAEVISSTTSGRGLPSWCVRLHKEQHAVSVC